jgi:sialidase-1
MKLMNPFRLRRFAAMFLLFLCAGSLAMIDTVEGGSTAVFIERGRPLDLDASSGGWKRVDGFYGAKGTGSRLIGGQGVGPGDFHVVARIRIEGLNNSACGFVMGDSFFGFEGAHGKVFLTGRLFDGARGLPIGDPEQFIQDGRPFLFEAIRRGERIRFQIDGRLVHERTFTSGLVGRIGFASSRASLRLAEFRVAGNSNESFLKVIPAGEPYRMKEVKGVHKVVLLPPKKQNPRNSEGDFMELKDGRVLFVYTHFTGGASDHATAHLAARYSSDGGLSWTAKDEIIVRNEGGFNVMSVSLLRLTNGEIALFYIRKNSHVDCRPLVRFSRDEGRSWSEAVEVIKDRIGYHVLNNDRVIQLKSGRLLAPLALHHRPEYEKPDWDGRILCYLSDDNGRSWRRNPEAEFLGRHPDGRRITFQEPGVVELKDGRVLMFIRTREGMQYQAWSVDRGLTWSKPEPSPIKSPQSPATIERIPTTGDLLLAWNDHSAIPDELRGKRTPFSLAISRNEGKSWERVKALEDDPNGWYCYTAMAFIGDRVLLGHCAGDRRTGGLNTTQITSFTIDWLYR